MIVKSNLIFIIIFLSLTVTLPAQSSNKVPDNIDLIVMVDTSSSMFPFFNDVVDYLISDILYKKLKVGDTFHLLSFADKPAVELSEKIKGPKSKEKILKSIALLQPLGRYTDLVSAIKFLYQYVKELPFDNLKNVLLLTDGIHDPPPWSPYNNISREEILKELNETSKAIKREGWSIHVIQMPAIKEKISKNISKETQKKNIQSTTQENLIQDISQIFNTPVIKYNNENKKTISNVATGFPYLTWPKDIGNVGRRFVLPLTINRVSDKPIYFQLSKILVNDTNVLEHPISTVVKNGFKKTLKAKIVLPKNMKKGKHELNMNFVYNGKDRITPEQGIIVIHYSGEKGLKIDYQLLLNIVYVMSVILAILGIIFIFYFLKNRVIGVAFEQYMHLKSSGERRPIEMRVEFQNPHIGFRNIHTIPENHSKSVGGGNSDYLIFLLPVPPRIAQIYNKDKEYIFKPIKKDFFPDIDQEVKDCLNKKIRFVSIKGHESTLYFKEYVSPLEEINKLMHSIESSINEDGKTKT